MGRWCCGSSSRLSSCWRSVGGLLSWPLAIFRVPAKPVEKVLPDAASRNEAATGSREPLTARRGGDPVATARRIEAFLEMLAAERGAARLTLSAYRTDLEDLAAFLAARGVALEGADAAALHDYVGAMTDRAAWRRGPLARRLSAMRQFFRFLISDGSRADDPTADLDTPRLGRPLPKILSRSEVETLIAAAADWPGEEGVRLRCILELLYATGLRVSELVDAAAGRGAPRPALSGRARQRRQGAGRAVERAGAAGSGRISRMPRPASAADRSGRPEGRALAVPVARRRGPPDAAALRPAAEGAGAEGRARPGPAVAACAAPRLRQPSARRRRRSAQRAADARPRRYRDDADLYPCPGRAAAPAGRDGAPAGAQRKD